MSPVLFSTCLHVSSLMWLPRSRDTYEGPVPFPWLSTVVLGRLDCMDSPSGYKEAAIAAQELVSSLPPEPTRLQDSPTFPLSREVIAKGLSGADGAKQKTKTMYRNHLQETQEQERGCHLTSLNPSHSTLLSLRAPPGNCPQGQRMAITKAPRLSGGTASTLVSSKHISYKYIQHIIS